MTTVDCYRLLSTLVNYWRLLYITIEYYRLLSVIIDYYRPRCDSHHGYYIRQFYTGGGCGGGGDGCQGLGLYSVDGGSGGKRQIGKKVEVVVA